MRKVFGFGLLLSFVFSTFYLFSDQLAIAQTPTREQQIETLSETLTIIREAIRTSTRLTDTERLVLYTQLVTISDTVLKLQKSENVPTVKVLEDQSEIDLTNAILSYDLAKPTEVEAKTFFASTSMQVKTLNYPQLLNYASFGQRMSAVRQFGTYDLAQEFSLSQTEVRRITHITGRNSSRDENFAMNSQKAYELAEDFGKYSIITSVDIFPGDKVGSIVLKSDQAEILKIEIKKNLTQIDPKDPKSDDTKYSYYQKFIIDDAMGLVLVNPRDRSEKIAVETLIEDVERGELIKLLANLFDKDALSLEIENFEDKILEFMFENKTYLLAGENAQYKPEDRQCFEESDFAVMRQVALSLLEEMNAQHKTINDMFTLQASVRNIDGGSNLICKNTNKVF